jgi:hypothetical protein
MYSVQTQQFISHINSWYFAHDFFPPIVTETEFSLQALMKATNIEFHAILSSGSRDDTCGRTDMKKLMNAFCDFVNAPNNIHATVFVI